MEGGNDIIELNVGGQMMTTKRSTLCQVDDSLLASMFSGRWEASLSRDKDGRIFLDFNPIYFTFILDYLRAKRIPRTGVPTRLPKVAQNQVDNFYKLIEYLGLADEMLPKEVELFQGHSQGIKLEENGVGAVFYAPERNSTVNRDGRCLVKYLNPTNEFVLGQNIYKGGIFRLKLKVQSYLGTNIWVGVVDGEVTPDRITNNHNSALYGWDMNKIVQDEDILDYTIQLVLDCEKSTMFLKVPHDGLHFNMKLPEWNTWRILVKFGSLHPMCYMEHGLTLALHVHILELIRECY